MTSSAPGHRSQRATAGPAGQHARRMVPVTRQWANGETAQPHVPSVRRGAMAVRGGRVPPTPPPVGTENQGLSVRGRRTPIFERFLKI